MNSHLNRSYAYLIEIFGPDKLMERYSSLCRISEFFIEAFELGKCFRPSKSIIQELVLDYFADIARLKEFHDIKKVHPFKVASYTAYWVLRRSPIQMYAEPEGGFEVGNDCATAINQFFAAILFVGWAYDFNNPQESSEKFDEFFVQLYYLMLYRHYTPQLFELVLHAMNINPPFESVKQKYKKPD